VTVPAPGGVLTRVAMGTGEISMFRRGPGGPVLFLHAAGGAGEWSPFHERLSRHFDLVAPTTRVSV
jgi:hypothetical protein